MRVARPASYYTRFGFFGISFGLTEHSSVEVRGEKKRLKKNNKSLVVESLLQKKREKVRK